jgi:hypothetical protein
MIPRQLTLAATGTALTLPVFAHAHGSGAADNGVYHYLSNPDHVISFVVLGVVVLALAVRLTHTVTRASQRDKH